MYIAANQPDFSLILAVYTLLLAFGMAYNALIAWAERKRYLEGFVSFAVVLGVILTLGGVALLDSRAALLTLGAFVASGFPMVAGSVIRYVLARKQEQEYERQAATLAKRSERSER